MCDPFYSLPLNRYFMFNLPIYICMYTHLFNNIHLLQLLWLACVVIVKHWCSYVFKVPVNV